MEMEISKILMGFLTVFGVLFTIYSAYYVLIALFGLRQVKAAPRREAKTRFALLVAARNEEAVIGELCDSLAAQDYPRELYDVIVAPNNCTDDTRGQALRHGAAVFDPEGPVSSKGEVLSQLVSELLIDDKYDAICVFDADNLVHPAFLQSMNDAYANGAQAAQSFRDSKNPRDTAISAASSAWYWMLSRFYNGGRQKLGLSSLVNGSGFMVSTALLRRMGGWHTHTMTEDYEFTAQCLLAGERVHYVPSAIIYDEQPLDFGATWKQRRRWCTGGVQGAARYLRPLAAKGLRQRSCALLDLSLTYLMPYLQLPSLVFGAVSFGYFATRAVHMGLLGPGQLLAAVVLLALAAGCFLAFVALLVQKLGRGRVLPGTIGGIFFFPLYVLSWTPITVISLFSKQKSWEPIAHTRRVSMGQMGHAA
ncbi:glycosyltransferase [Ruminococcaceae bacterium OttesenSCG-928-I18]|nr:glycosyltransferase [Ruminococcaceae bacterium OttesenSCG-928-I18]